MKKVFAYLFFFTIAYGLLVFVTGAYVEPIFIIIVLLILNTIASKVISSKKNESSAKS